MKRYLIICLFVHLSIQVMGQPYLEKSQFDDRFAAVIETNNYVFSLIGSRKKASTSNFYTYMFSNSSGTPMVAVYLTFGEPYLMHDWENNKQYYLGYTVIERDTILFYSDIFDFYPNGVAEDYLKGFNITNDSTFDNYYHPHHWYEAGLDDPPYKTFKIKRNGRLSIVDKKQFFKKSKWYIKTYRNTSPPPPPPKLPRKMRDHFDEK
ncbi:MAG: hypothetical protein J5543_00020 [Bacteroidales bacterium]|nr:hypothetical protein [Bacteroidales bacterium]